MFSKSTAMNFIPKLLHIRDDEYLILYKKDYVDSHLCRVSGHIMRLMRVLARIQAKSSHWNLLTQLSLASLLCPHLQLSTGVNIWPFHHDENIIGLEKKLFYKTQ